MKQYALRKISLILNLYFQINPLAVYYHVNIKTAEFVAKAFRRHFGVSDLELLNAFKPDIKQFRNKLF
jgi:hypothetical protein